MFVPTRFGLFGLLGRANDLADERIPLGDRLRSRGIQQRAVHRKRCDNEACIYPDNGPRASDESNQKSDDPQNRHRSEIDAEICQDRNSRQLLTSDSELKSARKLQ